MVHVIRETFPNFDILLSTLNKRPNNSAMSGEHDSRTNSYEFCKTKNYDEAISLLRSGYKDILPRIKDSLEDKERFLSKLYVAPKIVPYSSIVGFTPNVPNAIMNLPNSMIDINREPRKQRTVSIMYLISSSWDRSVNFFIDAGVALVSAINILERYGIQTKLTIVFESVKDRYDDDDVNEVVVSDVCIKNYGQRFNLQKICFPLAHPSMFRRFGFKYLETAPGLQNSSFREGYGYPLKNVESVHRFLKVPKDTHIFTSDWIHKNGNSVKAILDELELI